MNKKKWLIWTVVALLLLILFIYSIPGLTFCCIYHNIISEPLAMETLSIKPQIIELSQPNNSCVFSLGFAFVPLCPDSISSIRYTKDTGLIFKTDSNSITYYFLLPDRPLDVNEITKYSKGSIKDYYDLQVRIASLTLKKYSEIFFNPHKMWLDIILARFKTDPFNQRGIGLFETDNIKGIIRFGPKNNPCSLMVEIFSNDGNITQLITVASESPQKSKEALFSLLSSYQFTISQVPEINFLDELIVNELGGNSKFKIDNKNQ